MPAIVVSADSHVTEHPDAYRVHIDPAYRERAPYVVSQDDGADFYVIPDLPQGMIPIGLVAAAGKRSEDIRLAGRFEDWHRGGWDPLPRLDAQDEDGIAAEILHPTVGLVLCRHPDLAYKRACMTAYNRWLAEYCAAAPARLFGVGQTAVRTPSEGIDDLRAIAELGFRGVMLPSIPGEEDWASPVYDDFWRATLDLGLVPSFHILTDPGDALPRRGSPMAFAVGIIRSNDFPHSDSTWPRSQALIAEHFAPLADAERASILHGNVTSLYGLPV